jgi:single-strand DNA-binding protein
LDRPHQRGTPPPQTTRLPGVWAKRAAHHTILMGATVMLFSFVFEGNLATDPELRFTPAGKAVCSMRVGHNTRRFDPAKGEWVNGQTMWVNVTAWEKLAERLAESLRKGDTVIVETRDDLGARAYIPRDSDEPAASLQVTAANVSLSLRFKPANSADLVSARTGGDEQFSGDEAPF